MLLHIPHVLRPTELAQVRQLMLAADWADGRLTAGSQSGSVKHNFQLPEELPAAQQVRYLVSVVLARSPMFVTGTLPKSVYPPLFNRYLGGSVTNRVGDHVDNAPRTNATTAQHVRSDISCTLFLNDPASYGGGVLVVQDTYGEHRIKFDGGDLVMYPGTSVHRVEPVTHGERLVSFFWIEGMVRADAQRRLLYDMDTAIISLRCKDQAITLQGATDCAEVVQLTGCYHNQLRMWADIRI